MEISWKFYYVFMGILVFAVCIYALAQTSKDAKHAMNSAYVSDEFSD